MKPTTILASALMLLTGALAGGCGGAATSSSPPASRIQHGNIVLSAQGAQRIGVQTELARSRSGRVGVTVPFSAVVYDSSGKAYAFTSPAPLTFTEVPVRISHISGSTAYLSSGPPAGTRVVTVGAEELFGVQTGVLAQT